MCNFRNRRSILPTWIYIPEPGNGLGTLISKGICELEFRPSVANRQGSDVSPKLTRSLKGRSFLRPTRSEQRAISQPPCGVHSTTVSRGDFDEANSVFHHTVFDGLDRRPGAGRTSRISGVATDASGAVVPNAVITATNDDTGISYSTKTSASGTYSFDSLQIGRYTVRAEAPGFGPFVSTGNVLAIGVPTEHRSQISDSGANRSRSRFRADMTWWRPSLRATSAPSSTTLPSRSFRSSARADAIPSASPSTSPGSAEQ